jgi:hypothetical protein
MLLLCGTKLLKRCPETVCLCYQELNSEPVVPEGFPEWVELMNGWGHKMISAVEIVAEMAAIGFGLPRTSFTSMMANVTTTSFFFFLQTNSNVQCLSDSVPNSLTLEHWISFTD